VGPLDAFWHLLNFFAVAIGVGAIGAAAVKLLWRRELAAVPWRSLAAWSCSAGAAASIGGLVVFGRDGRMATYAAVVLAAALSLWWSAFVRR
jgi:hypothetical protein